MEVSIPLLVFLNGISGLVIMFGFRVWEIRVGRANAGRDRRNEEIFFITVLRSIGKSCARLPFLLGRMMVPRTLSIWHQARYVLANNRGAIRFSNLVRGRYEHQGSSKSSSSFLQDVAEHKNKLPEGEIEE